MLVFLSSTVLNHMTPLDHELSARSIPLPHHNLLDFISYNSSHVTFPMAYQAWPWLTSFKVFSFLLCVRYGHERKKKVACEDAAVSACMHMEAHACVHACTRRPGVEFRSLPQSFPTPYLIHWGKLSSCTQKLTLSTRLVWVASLGKGVCVSFLGTAL